MRTERAEQATAAVMRVLAAYRSGRGRLAGVGTGGRLRPAYEWVDDESTPLAEIVALVEVFTDERFEDAYGYGMVGTSWHDRRRAWKQNGVNIEHCPVWGVVDALIHARNAVLHNSGRLTRLQVKTSASRAATIASLSVAGIVVGDHDQLVLTPTQVEAAAVAARMYVTWLDANAP